MANAPNVEPLLTAEQCGLLLGKVSAAHVDRLRMHAGLPAINIGLGTPGRRVKAMWRYDAASVCRWWLSRERTA